MSDISVNNNATSIWSTLPSAPAAPAAPTGAPAPAAGGTTPAPAGDSSSVSGTDRLYTPIWSPDLGMPPTDAPKPADQKNWSAPAITERWNAEIVLPDPPRPPIDGGTFRSWGDPHEVTGDGLKFDNMLTGTFTAFQSASGDLVLQKFQEKDEAGRWAGATLNKAAGIKMGDNTVSYDIRGDQLTVNGQKVSTAPGSSYALPDGGSVSIAANGNITVNGASGDKITVEKFDGYINFSGEVAPWRQGGSVFGSIGSFDEDKDPTNDLIRPDGTKFPITYVAEKSANNQVGESQAYVDQFLELWRVPTDKDLIPTR